MVGCSFSHKNPFDFNDLKGFRATEVHRRISSRYRGNVENFVLLLLGIKDQSNLLCSTVNFIKMFDNIKEFNLFLVTLQLEMIILIVTDLFVEFIENFSRFHSIYLISSQVNLNIERNFPNLRSIEEHLKQKCSRSNDFFSIQFVSSDENRTHSFCYSALLKEILLAKDTQSNLKKDFLDFCRFHYNENPDQLSLIDEFERNFSMEKSVWWHQRNSFVRKMLDRALRTREIDILYKIRCFIQALHQQIKQEEFSATVHRIYHCSLDELTKFQENNLLSFDTFVQCTSNQPSFIDKIQGMETILFRIITTVGIEIEKHSGDSEAKGRVLLPFDNLYRIQSIENDLNHQYWNVRLLNISQDDQVFKQLTKEIREQIEGHVVLIRLGKLLLFTNDYCHADYLARLLFDDGSLKHSPILLASLAALHHLLGSVDYQQNRYRIARRQFERALKIFLSFIAEDHPILSTTYNNIGSMFYQEDQHEQAIVYHQKALRCQLRSSSADIEAIATYLSNIAAVYVDQEKYPQALLHYQRSLQILQQSTPTGESQSIATVCDRIASVYWKMDKPNEALPFYQRALQLELKYLPENHRKISVSFFNLSTVYAKVNRLDDAIDCAQKSLQQLLKSVPRDHREAKENSQQLEELRRRKCLQQLYQ